MIIDAQRLKELRNLKKLSQDRLAKKAKITKRTIQRLESSSEGSQKVRERTTIELAEALGVEIGVLTGKLPIPESYEAQRRPESERVPISALIAPEAHLAYALIGRRYGVKTTTIMNIAPLLFALLAEGSLNWRREKLRELFEATDRMNDIGRVAGHLAYAHCVCHATDPAAEEKESIEKVDLFGEQVSEEAFEFGFDRSTQNPLADYIRKLASDLDNPSIVEVDPDGDKELGRGALENFPQYRVCKNELEQISSGSSWAAFALEYGHARLSEIPEELWREDATAERAKWLEDRVPDDIRSFISSVDVTGVLAEPPSDGGHK